MGTRSALLRASAHRLQVAPPARPTAPTHPAARRPNARANGRVLALSLCPGCHELTRLKPLRYLRYFQFAIETPELALFKDELRLWRQPSTLIPASVLSDLPLERSTLPPYVPELILDVILDLNLVPEHALFRQRGPDAIRIKRPSEVKGIVLERWRLSFECVEMT